MGIGPRLRRLFGRYERPVAEAYRRLFVDLDALVASIAREVEAPARILEIGCGEGAVTERLAAAFPSAELTGIDICAAPGRLFGGDRSRVQFLRAELQTLVASGTRRHELVVLADVLHHVPQNQRRRLLENAALATATDGVLVLKDWVRRRTPAYYMGYLSDRLITGDRVYYETEADLRRLVSEACPSAAFVGQFHVPPWRSNLALLIAPNARTALR